MPNKNIIKDADAPRSNHPALRAPLLGGELQTPSIC